MQLGHPYVHWVLNDPVLKPVYANEAQKRQMRACDFVMSDFLKDPVIASIDPAKYTGQAGGWLLILTGDDFKVVRVGWFSATPPAKESRKALQSRRREVSPGCGFTPLRKDLAAGQTLTIEVAATDRCGHSTVLTTTHPI